MSSLAPEIVSAQDCSTASFFTGIDVNLIKSNMFRTEDGCGRYCNRFCGADGVDGIGICEDKLCCCVA
ncbi:hypothetical protein MKX01_031644 [Papaver californicum]|nr:hypothetical protein MKX01_031644 [Papaver californicum]